MSPSEPLATEQPELSFQLTMMQGGAAVLGNQAPVAKNMKPVLTRTQWRRLGEQREKINC